LIKLTEVRQECNSPLSLLGLCLPQSYIIPPIPCHSHVSLRTVKYCVIFTVIGLGAALDSTDEGAYSLESRALASNIAVDTWSYMYVGALTEDDYFLSELLSHKRAPFEGPTNAPKNGANRADFGLRPLDDGSWRTFIFGLDWLNMLSPNVFTTNETTISRSRGQALQIRLDSTATSTIPLQQQKALFLPSSPMVFPELAQLTKSSPRPSVLALPRIFE